VVEASLAALREGLRSGRQQADAQTQSRDVP
jgi:hypothetical protein